jgi:hypothetical protein
MGDLSFLIGIWRGEGRGGYPSIEDFTYSEEMTFTDAGGGLIVYQEKAWDSENGESIHSEFGYLRMLEDGSVDLTLAYPFGVSETMEGALEGQKLVLASVSVGVASQGEPVTALRRVIEVERDGLVYETEMSTPKHEMSRHLAGQLTRS